jgi:hypothetical protein
MARQGASQASRAPDVLLVGLLPHPRWRGSRPFAALLITYHRKRFGITNGFLSHCPLLTCETRFKYKMISERVMPKSGRATAPGFLLRHARARPRQEE